MARLDPDRVSRAWLALLTVYMVFQGPLMNQKLAMACGSAMEAIKGLRQNRAELNDLRLEIQARQEEFRRDPIPEVFASVEPHQH